MEYLSDEILERSSVVANCCMNRERNLTGPNGYTRELGTNPLDLLRARIPSAAPVRWLDLCCGSGMALVEAAQIVVDEGLVAQVQILGVDLVGRFFHASSQLTCLSLVEASLSTWK